MATPRCGYAVTDCSSTSTKPISIGAPLPVGCPSSLPVCSRSAATTSHHRNQCGTSLTPTSACTLTSTSSSSAAPIAQYPSLRLGSGLSIAGDVTRPDASSLLQQRCDRTSGGPSIRRLQAVQNAAARAAFSAYAALYQR
jgi:hypothetical protein